MSDEPRSAAHRASDVQRLLAALGAEQEQIRAELHAQTIQLGGVILLVTMLGAMIWLVSKQLDGLEVAT